MPDITLYPAEDNPADIMLRNPAAKVSLRDRALALLALIRFGLEEIYENRGHRRESEYPIQIAWRVLERIRRR